MAEIQYSQYTEDWMNRQKQWSKVMNKLIDKQSLPNKKEKYANFTCKMVTGTIWTNKLKKRLKMQEDD